MALAILRSLRTMKSLEQLDGGLRGTHLNPMKSSYPLCPLQFIPAGPSGTLELRPECHMALKHMLIVKQCKEREGPHCRNQDNNKMDPFNSRDSNQTGYFVSHFIRLKRNVSPRLIFSLWPKFLCVICPRNEQNSVYDGSFLERIRYRRLKQIEISGHEYIYNEGVGLNQNFTLLAWLKSRGSLS